MGLFRRKKLYELGNEKLTKEEALEKIKYVYKDNILTKDILMLEYKLENEAMYPKPGIHTNAMKRVRFVNKKPFSKYANMIEIMDCYRVRTKALSKAARYSDRATKYVVNGGFITSKFEQNAIHVALKDFIIEENYNPKLEAYEVDDVQKVIDTGLKWARSMWLSDIDEGRRSALLEFLDKYPQFKTPEYYDYMSGKKDAWEDMLRSIFIDIDKYSGEEKYKINEFLGMFIREKKLTGEAEYGRVFDFSWRVLHDFK